MNVESRKAGKRSAMLYSYFPTFLILKSSRHTVKLLGASAPPRTVFSPPTGQISAIFTISVIFSKKRLATGPGCRSSSARNPHGALAQLVEHLHGMQGVSGSNPLRSISPYLQGKTTHKDQC
jgi:hypothetical protein